MRESISVCEETNFLCAEMTAESRIHPWTINRSPFAYVSSVPFPIRRPGVRKTVLST